MISVCVWREYEKKSDTESLSQVATIQNNRLYCLSPYTLVDPENGLVWETSRVTVQCDLA